jgi:hypothetical protein
MDTKEIRTLSGELRYGADDKQILPELSGTILLPKSRAMLTQLCEHRKAVMNGTYKSKPLSEETMRRFRLRPEYAKPGAPPTLRTSEAERAECRRKAQEIIDEHEAIQRNRLLLSSL